MLLSDCAAHNAASTKHSAMPLRTLPHVDHAGIDGAWLNDRNLDGLLRIFVKLHRGGRVFKPAEELRNCRRRPAKLIPGGDAEFAGREIGEAEYAARIRHGGLRGETLSPESQRDLRKRIAVGVAQDAGYGGGTRRKHDFQSSPGPGG